MFDVFCVNVSVIWIFFGIWDKFAPGLVITNPILFPLYKFHEILPSWHDQDENPSIL